MKPDEFSRAIPVGHLRRFSEQRTQIPVEDTPVADRQRVVHVAIMLRDRVAHRCYRQVIIGQLRSLRLHLAHFAHHRVDVLQLPERAPAFVLRAPIDAGREPHGERFREVFVRVFLRVPPQNVADVLVSKWIGPVPVAVRSRVGAEHFVPVGAIVQPIGVVERVTGFVPEESHHVVLVLYREREVFFDARQPRIGEIERDADQRRAVGAAPLVAEIHGGPEREAALIELDIKLRHELLEDGAFEGKPDVRYPLRKEPLALDFPVAVRGHVGAYGQWSYRPRMQKTPSLCAAGVLVPE